MKKKIVFALSVICTMNLLAGCEKTPEDVIVRQKGETDVSNFEEVSTADTGSRLAEKLGAPQSYQDEKTSDDGKLKITIDADVEIPDAEAVPVYKVTEKEFTQDFIDTVTEVFFGAAPAYADEEYYRSTKEEIGAGLAEYKEELATGNFDLDVMQALSLDGEQPVSETEYKEYLQDVIDGLELEYETAPETLVHTEVIPEMGNGEFQNRYVVEVNDTCAYSYTFSKQCGDTVEIRKIYPEFFNLTPQWIGYQIAKNGDMPMTKQEVEALAGITREEAQAAADEKVKALGIPDMELKEWDLAVLRVSDLPESVDSNEYQIKNGGYWFHYTRKVGGIPITYTGEWGGGLESMEDNRETWYYERLNILVNKDGIEEVDISSLYEIGKEEASSVKLLEFEEVMTIFKDMLLISNADITAYANWQTFHIESITFGYMRIYEPNVDGRSGMLVPVWDFYGSSEVEYMENEGESAISALGKDRSFLTINAMDGTVISRDLGY